MGRWLEALKKHENAVGTSPQNPQKPSGTIFGGFGGRASGPNQETLDTAFGIMGVLGAPLPDGTGNPRHDNQGVEGRTPGLKNDVGPSRDEAGRAVGGESLPVAPPRSDAELYAEALRQIQPCGYGPIAAFLGWGMTRAANAEAALREAGSIKYDRTGRGEFVGRPIPARASRENS
jgi:hypothetical protein